MNTRKPDSSASCKIVAPSSREALRLLREKLGPDAIILSNRVTAEGVEIIATLDEAHASGSELAPAPASPTMAISVSTPASISAPVLAPQSMPISAGEDASVLREIHSMRGMIEEQLASIAWNEKQRRDPVRGQLLRTLLGAGFSARLAKEALQDLPTGQSYASGLSYAKAELARQMPVLENEEAMMEAGGVYALMGPTGVGKTTTTAKLAARCVMRFGPEKLALVTTDSYRIGAYEQLRIYGQILGVAVHAVKDAAGLDRVLADLRDKHMVLIDTVGMSQRDRAVSEQIAMLCAASRPVKRLLLLNGSSHGDTLNEVVQAYKQGAQTAGNELAGCIFTKVDEATHPGVLIDMAIRHQLPVHYISTGQKVPEHLVLADRQALINRVLQAKSASALFVPGETDLDQAPAAPGKQVELDAAQALSARLRSQCQQLIRALTHDAQEIASNASALAGAAIGFDESRALWRQLSDASVDAQALGRSLLARADDQMQGACNDYLLALGCETSLPAALDPEQRRLASTLLLSDRDGRPFAAPQRLLAASDQLGSGAPLCWQAQKFDKPLVHLLARLPAMELVRKWQDSGLSWAAAGSAALRVADAGSGKPGTLAKLAGGLDFGVRQAVMHRKRKAWASLAEAQVRLHVNPGAVGASAVALPLLRCVVRRLIDAESGKTLSHSYVLATVEIQASTRQVAQWPSWRSAAEPYFKLLKQGLSQLAGAPLDAAATLQRCQIAAQAASTVFLLQGIAQPWADTARKVLAQLAGRAVRSDRPVPGAALFEGLGKLFVLLDALETDAAVLAPEADRAAAQA